MSGEQTPAGERILTTAGRLFYEDGIHAVGMEAIAESAGVTKKTIDDRFGSKDRLIEAYLRARSERWRACCSTRSSGRLDDPVARLLATFDALGSWLKNDGRRGCAFVNARAELTEPGNPGRRVAEEEKAWLLGYLTRLAGETSAGAPDLLAKQLFMLHEGAAVAHATRGDDGATESARDAAAALIRLAS